MAEVTRQKTLERCLNYLVSLKKMDSRDGRGLVPRDPECEESFYELQEECRIIREIMQDYQNPEIRDLSAKWRNPAKWQQEIIDGKRPDLTELEPAAVVTEPEWEGDPANGYWLVCGECHGQIGVSKGICKHCGARIDWTHCKL